MTSTALRPLPPLRWLVLLLGSLAAFAPLSIDMYLPAFPQIAADFGVELGRVQLTLSVFLVGLAVGQAFYGPLADRWGRRAPLLFGITLFVLSSMGCALAGSMGALTVSRLCMALGGSVGMVVTRAVVRDSCNETESAHLYSLLMLVMGVAPILAPLLGGQMLLVSSWRAIFWLVAVFGAVSLVAVFRWLPDTLPRERRTRHGVVDALRIYGRLALNTRFLGYVLAVSCTSGVLFGYIAGAPIVFIEQHGISPQWFGLFFGANAGGLIAASQLNRWLLRRWSTRRVLDVAYALHTIAAVLLLVQVLSGWGGFAALVGVLFICIASAGVIFPNIPALAMTPFGAVAGSASAFMGTLQYGLGGVAGTLVGLLHDGTARPLAFVVAGCSLAGWMMLRWMAPDVGKA
ncbi:MAG: multidrug effflux MFS transporter [Opitutaceae bacterium]|nr:multidrug effflux MFS transporter [Opitutaceae bacterium]